MRWWMSCWRSKSLYQEGPFHPEGAFCVLSGFIKRRRAGQRHEEAQHGKPRAASSATHTASVMRRPEKKLFV